MDISNATRNLYSSIGNQLILLAQAMQERLSIRIPDAISRGCAGGILEMQWKHFNHARISTFLSPRWVVGHFTAGSTRKTQTLTSNEQEVPRIAYHRNLTTGNRVMYKDVRQRNKPHDGVEFGT